MNGMSLFKLVDDYTGEILDLTTKIEVPSYKVNNKPIYNEWTDGDLKVHRDTMRHQLEGSFTLLYFDKDEYQDFLTFYREALDETYGYINAYVYSNNDHELVLTKVFMDFELANEMPFMGIKDVDGIDVTIREV